MADCRFTSGQVATWLEEANGSRRARWLHWPNARALAADLCECDLTDRFTTHRRDVRQVQQTAAMMRKVATAFDHPSFSREVHWSLCVGAAMASAAVRMDDGEDHLMAIARGGLDAMKFPDLLRWAADEAEFQVTRKLAWAPHVDHLRIIYGTIAKTLERHTGTPPSIRPMGTDAKFVRNVLQHTGLPWRARLWRRCGEGWARARRGDPKADVISRLGPLQRDKSLPANGP